jgi:hypothetical protein
VLAAAAASTDSTTGRRPVIVTSLSSSGSRCQPVIAGGIAASWSSRTQPAASRSSVSPGSSASSTWRVRASSTCGWRNWATPLRSQPSQAWSAGAAGTWSRSSTVTSWPSLASSIAVVSPTTLPPQMMMDDTGKAPFCLSCPPHPASRRGRRCAGALAWRHD